MDKWHPRAVKVQPTDGREGLSLLGAPWKIVLHTTESDSYTPDRTSYFGNPFWPTSTIVAGTIYQHLPIDVGAYAMAHDAGTAETNRANAIQCEIVWRAANGNWPEALLATVADWIRWVQSQTGVPTVFAEMFREGVTVASVDSPIRFGDQEWLDFHGICGHSNVPGGNDHWDPGRLPIDRLRAHLGRAPAPKVFQDMSDLRKEKFPMEFTYITGGEDWVWLGTERVFTRCGSGKVLEALKDGTQLVALGPQPDEVHTYLTNLAKNAGFTG